MVGKFLKKDPGRLYEVIIQDQKINSVAQHCENAKNSGQKDFIYNKVLLMVQIAVYNNYKSVRLSINAAVVCSLPEERRWMFCKYAEYCMLHKIPVPATGQVFREDGLNMEGTQKKYELIIKADEVISDDEEFKINNLVLGDKYKPVDAYFRRSNGEIIRRSLNKGEKKISNQTMPRIACQIFEDQLKALSEEEKENFPICKYTDKTNLICGIFPSVEEFKKHKNSLEFLVYRCADGNKFVMYCWNIFSTIVFVQECLNRCGESGDSFVLTYQKKGKKPDIIVPHKTKTEKSVYKNPYSRILVNSKNVIFRGAPGTGKSYLAKEIAADIISNGEFQDYTKLSHEQKKQMEFVQFHPGYDYSDFVEGLRPKINEDGSMGFELRDGIFKSFVERARKNFENSQKSDKDIEKEYSVQDAIENFLSEIDPETDEFKTVNGTKFYITDADDNHIYISIPGNERDKLTIKINELKTMLESGQKFTKVKDITAFFGKTFASQAYSYDLAIYKAISGKKKKHSSSSVRKEELKKFVFIIDEINRGEISKILGELFFSIDPGYRGRAGEVSTQYSNLHSDPEEKFYIPENIYIIGTMNDIDRSVDSFDFAMRRRFRFVEIKANERLDMLDDLEDEELEEEAIKRMTALNNAISDTEDLNANYHIGAAYFRKLKYLSFDQLWTDYLKPLLQEYINGMYDEEGIMKGFAEAYGYKA